MEISKISQAVVTLPEPLVANKSINRPKTQDKNDVATPNNLDIFNKKVSFLADGLDNSNHLDNNHPLGRADYSPIENMNEAKSLLDYFNTPEYRNVASNVQANVTPEAFLSLFAD
jgi:hypothetical protein